MTGLDKNQDGNPPSGLKCLLISDFNALNFAGYLANDPEQPPVDVLDAPYGQVVPLLADTAQPVWQLHPDFAVVWTQPEQVIPAFRQLIAQPPVAIAQILAEVDEFAALVQKASARLKWVFVPTWVQDPGLRGAGMADWLADRGLAHALAQMNLRLAEKFSASNVCLLDAQKWIVHAGSGAFSDKLWYQGKIPFSHPVFQAAVGDVKAALRGLSGQARKLIVLDLDETLWGGIVGDVGWEGLKLGGHDPVGEAYIDFQQALKALMRRGVVLAIVSKNEEDIALDAIRQHPEMQLELSDFAGWRINWEDKAGNLVDLVAELNLGLQSVVFIDDNPVERARIRAALPEVLAPEWPENPLFYKRALLALRCFDAPTISAEDRTRTQAYVAERQRGELKRQVGSVDDWLKSLAMVVTVEKLGPANLPRAAQLLNKTNQMNLTTRRLSEAEFMNWAAAPDQPAWVFRVSDKLGDSGLTGLASLKFSGSAARIVDFVLSCRVMGRKVEETMVYWLVAQAKRAGATEISAEYLPTAKNKPCLEFLQRSGFEAAGDGRFTWPTANEFTKPGFIEFAGGSEAAIAQMPPIGLIAGQHFDLSAHITAKTVQAFVSLTGDTCPLHTDPEYGKLSPFGTVVVHGMLPVLLLSALGLVRQPGYHAIFKKVSANFKQPVLIEDTLILSAHVIGVNQESREAAIEFSINKAPAGIEVSNGLVGLTLAKGDNPQIAGPGGSASPLMLCEPPAHEALEYHQINRGTQKSLRFCINDNSLRFYHQLLSETVVGFAISFEDWTRHCQATNLLASAMSSTFVGLCLPGRYGVFTNLDVTFNPPLTRARLYCLTGTVMFKSPSTAAIVIQAAVTEPGENVPLLASGKIHAAVRPPKPPVKG